MEKVEHDIDKPLTPVGDYVKYSDVLEGKLEPNTVYLLPFKRSAVPTALIAEQIRRSNVVNVEKARLGELPADGVYVLTRTTYRSSYKDYCLPSVDLPYVKKLYKFVRNNFGSVYIVTEEIYELIKEMFERRGFKKKYVLLDTETARKTLESRLNSRHASMLAKVGAILPWVVDKIGSEREEDKEEIKKYLNNLLGQEDGEEVYQTIENVFKGEWKNSNKYLAISLDALSSPSPECKKNRHKNCSGSFKKDYRRDDLMVHCSCGCHISGQA